jgi:hypothetical protein
MVVSIETIGMCYNHHGSRFGPFAVVPTIGDRFANEKK